MSANRARAQPRKAGAGEVERVLDANVPADGEWSRRRLRPASALRELRLLVAPALGDWSKVLQIVLILVTVFLGVAVVLFLGAVATKFVDWQVPQTVVVRLSEDAWSRDASREPGILEWPRAIGPEPVAGGSMANSRRNGTCGTSGAP